jgi:hypothetical protein
MAPAAAELLLRVEQVERVDKKHGAGRKRFRESYWGIH